MEKSLRSQMTLTPQCPGATEVGAILEGVHTEVVVEVASDYYTASRSKIEYNGGTMDCCHANVIAENLYTQVDDEER
eukprot:8441116-Ditylum_brightwellii.AAC.1